MYGPASGVLLTEGLDRGKTEMEAAKKQNRMAIAAIEDRKKKYADLARSLSGYMGTDFAEGGIARFLDGAGGWYE